MSEPGLGAILRRRFSGLVLGTLAGYAALMVVVFAVLSEVALRGSLEHTADVVQSLIGLYADPGGERSPVAPAMLADQLLGMDQPFLITRTVASDRGSPAIYYLSPTMPAKPIAPPRPGASAAEVRDQLASAVAARGRWRYRINHRRAGEFDILVAGSRVPYALGLAGLAAAAIALLPVAALLARRFTARAVTTALEPLSRVVADTQAIGPGDLSRRLTLPAGVAEVTEVSEALNRLLQRVERSRNALEAFTADASHELRTPLTHLRALGQWALDPRRTTDDLREALTGMAREGDRMTRMVEDLLLIARGENRELTLECREFDLVPVVREVEEIMTAMCTDRDLSVRAELNGPVRAVGDPGRTREILLNLASNAVRHTAEGGVTLTCELADTLVGVAVRDTGCGIESEHLQRIFDRFYRVDRSRSRAHGGAGLGLTIARLLAELQGGRIAVESTPGRGSTFVLWLPGVAPGTD